nr:uncharacterized protein LOC120095996 isoform X1 [Rattus norvegicus]
MNRLGRWGPGRSEGCKPRQQKTFSDARSHSSRCVYASRLDCRCPPDSSAIEKGMNPPQDGTLKERALNRNQRHPDHPSSHPHPHLAYYFWQLLPHFRHYLLFLLAPFLSVSSPPLLDQLTGTDTVFSGLWMSSAVPSTVADDGEVSLLSKCIRSSLAYKNVSPRGSPGEGGDNTRDPPKPLDKRHLEVILHQHRREDWGEDCGGGFTRGRGTMH